MMSEAQRSRCGDQRRCVSRLRVGDAQLREGSSKDTVNVRSEQVVWL